MAVRMYRSVMASILYNGDWVEIPDSYIRIVRLAALAQARAAIEALPLTGGWTTPAGVIQEIDKAKALAAIDALRDKG